MPSLSSHHSNHLVKLLLLGDAKSGKTGSLVSLVKAGYKLRILDMDNLLDILKYLVQKECPDKIDNVEYITLRDKRKTTSDGPVIEGMPNAFVKATRMLDRWKYDDVDLGVPADWGPECILVIDSLSRLCDAAYDWRFAISSKGDKYDGRAIYGDAQDAIENTLAMLTSKTFETNVIVIAHIQYMDLPDGTKKAYAQGVGQKLSPKIAQYFPSVVHYTNKNDKRTLRTVSTNWIDLANPAPFAMEPEYDTNTGLAKFFGVLMQQPKEVTEPEPIRKPVPLKRKI